MSNEWIEITKKRPPHLKEILLELSTGAIVRGRSLGDHGWDWADTNEANDSAAVVRWKPLP